MAKKRWGTSQGKNPKAAMSDATKAEIERKATELIETALKSKYVEPPLKEPKFNYLIGLSTKWHSRYFYFVATYACPGPNAISPTFEVNFARLEPTAIGRFNLAFMRHTEKWQELFNDLTLDDCLKSIRDDPWSNREYRSPALSCVPSTADTPNTRESRRSSPKEFGSGCSVLYRSCTVLPPLYRPSSPFFALVRPPLPYP